ncbi:MULTISPECIES: DUF4292 domain-containing protein [Chitinophagaceae]
MKFLKIVGIGAITIMASCHSAKKIASNTSVVPSQKDTTATVNRTVVDSAALANTVWTKWLDAALSYQTLSGKLGVSVNMPNLNQSFTANLRSEKDSLIWVSLTGPFGIEGARAKISTDSAIVINKLNSTVEKRSINYIQNLIHQPLSFLDIQNILTGRLSLQNAPMQSYQYNADGTWRFVFVQNNIQNMILLDPVSNRILQNKLTDRSAPMRTCTVQYKNFQNTAAGWMPWNISIEAQDKSPIKIELSYKQINFNQNLDYPFNIPAKYSVRQ